MQNAIGGRIRAHTLLLLFCTLSSTATSTLLEDLAVRVRGKSREFVYTNSRTAFLFGETNAPDRSSWHGFNVYGRELLDGVSLLVNDSLLSPSAPQEVVVYPDYLRRVYPGGLVEEIHPLDSLDAFVVLLRSPRPVSCALLPWITDARTAEALVVTLSNETALFARKAHLAGPADDPAPKWLAIHSPDGSPATLSRHERGRYAPAILSRQRAREHLFVIAAGWTREEAASLASRIPLFATRAIRERRERMERILAATEFHSGNLPFDRALAWAKLSLNALIMHQGARGIFAGLPWFNNYWGRDTFIALPGAGLAAGQTILAREILTAFAAEQQRDSLSTDYGRIPNFVGPREKAYNTADGTPRFVASARATIERSGDLRLLRSLYPVIIRSIEGTLLYHSDSLGFLTHGDAETWMDAVGPDGPWSPRGNRANDVQALWKQQLEAGIWFATRLGDAGTAVRWNEALNRLKRNFPRRFVQGETVADRIRPDGSLDMTLRPNQIFVGDLLEDSLRARILSTVTSRLTYPYGVASLSQEDDNFHPYHQYPPYYPKDAAYHNGTVWTWLQGPVTSELCRYGFPDTAWVVSAGAVRQILDHGAVGTQSELLDALPRPGNDYPSPSGTVSQAWNLAEFIRNAYEDYLGFHGDGLNGRVTFTPSLPDSLGTVRARIPFLAGSILFRSWFENGERKFAFRSERMGRPIDGELLIRAGRREGTRYRFSIPPDGPAQLPGHGEPLPMPGYPSSYPAPTLATPRLRDRLAALEGPAYPLIPHAMIKAVPLGAVQLLALTDPEGDDTGIAPDAHYTYPTGPLFLPGSFDLREFEVNADTSRFYFRLRFRTLSDPGWHPEYGFQLTFAAIAIDMDGIPGSGAAIIPQNASATLPPGHEYERLILVGGGIRVEDSRGRILAAYAPVPEDAVDPLGNADAGEINFALPREVLGGEVHPHGWRFTVVAGAQDDHGGAGLGEFRTVNRIASEWNGGGKWRPDLPNLFDVLEGLIP